MTDDDKTATPGAPAAPPGVARAEVRPRRFLSIVWLVPLVAVIIGGWLAYRTISEQGPSITIIFKTAEGITAGKTKIQYKAIEAGTVDSVRLATDLSHVIVEATMVAEIAGHLNEGARFWVVQPEISLAGVTGLNTLVSGDYIAFEPGDGKPTTTFKGLDRPPIEIDESAGHRYYLTTETLGSISKGGPVYYKGVTVGKVVDTYLSKDQRAVTIEIFVNKPEEDLVREGTLFWNVSGIQLDLGDIINASVHVESLQSLVAGGIAFDNPPNPGAIVEEGATFQLLAKYPKKLIEVNPVQDGLILHLRAELLGSLKTGDPILYREFQVGQILRVRLSDDAATVDIDAVIEPRYAPLVKTNSVFWNASGVHASFGLFSGVKVDLESLQTLLAGGIAFATPDSGGGAVEAGATFLLYDKPKDEWKDWAPHIRLPSEAQVKATEAGQESGDAAPSATQEAPQQAAQPIGPAMPTAVDLPIAGDRVTGSMMVDHLEALGFTNISEVEKQGAIFHVKAAWQAEPVSLRIDARDGTITRQGE